MALAAEGNRAAIDKSDSRAGSRSSSVWLIARGLAAVALMTIAGNCFLEYLWWTAKYSALAGVPKLASQWQVAGTRASVYGWSLLLLEVASFLILCSLIRFRSIESSKLGITLRLIASLLTTVFGTGMLALVLSWIKQTAP